MESFPGDLFFKKVDCIEVPQKHLIPGCNLSVVTFYSIKPNFYLKIKSGYRTQKLLPEEPTMQRTGVLKLNHCLTLIKPHAEMCTVTWPLFDFTNSFYSGVEWTKKKIKASRRSIWRLWLWLEAMYVCRCSVGGWTPVMKCAEFEAKVTNLSLSFFCLLTFLQVDNAVEET